MPGTLYIVATPIGNLEDITHRAVRILREVDCIACEDTRETRKLLTHYGIVKPTVSLHEHNEHARTAEIVERLRAGSSIALVSDAGTPLVSDPGYRLVARAAAEGLPVVPVPGPSALLAALAAAGLPTDSFVFGGFLPARTAQRRRALESRRDEAATLIFYEAPHRIVEALRDVNEVLGERRVVVARELTKMHEEFLRGTAAELAELLAARPSVKGEITLLIGKGAGAVTSEAVPEAVEALVKSGAARMDAIKAVARRQGLSKRDVYRMMESASDSRDK